MPSPEFRPPFEQPEAQTEQNREPFDYSQLLHKMEKSFDVTKSTAAQEAFAADRRLHCIYEMHKVVEMMQGLYILNLEIALIHAIKDREEKDKIIKEVQSKTMTAPPTQIFLQIFEEKFGKIEFPNKD